MINTTQNWEIGDCLDLLPSIDDKSINMILCDLPYGTTACSWDTIIPFKPLWKEWKRIITNNGAIVLTASQPFTSKLIMSNLEMFKYELIWNKILSTGHLNSKIMPLKKHEDIIIFANGKINYNPIMEKRNKIRINKSNGKKYHGDGLHTYGAFNSVNGKYNNRYPTSILEISNANKKNILHPTQKPVKLFEYLIKTYTNEGDWVHDSCLGSGTILEACRKTNRNCIGFEISNEWESHYSKRCMKNTPQLETWF